MGLSGRPHVAAMLEEQRTALDRLFGRGGYGIEATGDYAALLKTPVADFVFTDDPRDFVSASISAVPGIDIIQSPLEIWMAFLDQDVSAPRRSDPYQRQLADELEWLGIIVEKVLKDQATARDAAWFVAGYNRAYNHWASGKGSWAEPELGD